MYQRELHFVRSGNKLQITSGVDWLQ